jgi:hypothetical protein
MSLMDDITGLLAKLAPDVLRELLKLATNILSAPENERLEIAKRSVAAAVSKRATEEAVDRALKG